MNIDAATAAAPTQPPHDFPALLSVFALLHTPRRCVEAGAAPFPAAARPDPRLGGRAQETEDACSNGYRGSLPVRPPLATAAGALPPRRLRSAHISRIAWISSRCARWMAVPAVPAGWKPAATIGSLKARRKSAGGLLWRVAPSLREASPARGRAVLGWVSDSGEGAPFPAAARPTPASASLYPKV